MEKIDFYFENFLNIFIFCDFDCVFSIEIEGDEFLLHCTESVINAK